MHTDGEVMDTAAQDAEVAKLMELDTNKDANLSFDEFGEWCKTTMAAIYDTRSAAATAKRKDEAAAKAEAAAAAAEVQADATAAAAKVKAEDAAAKALAEAEAAAAAAKAKAEAAATTYASAYAEAAAASASAEEGVPMVRKYFTEEHERMLNRMVPPADADGNASADTSLDKLPTLADATAPATELSGVLFAQLLVGGFFNLYANLDRLNKENEFPIPDADTGTNMVICFKKAVRHLVEETAKAGPDCSLIAATEGFADDVVMNGQGNSGTILSHFFKTMADEVKALGKPSITCAELAAVLDATGAAMQKAVPTVFEGTMISCARDGTAGLGATKHESIQALCAAWTAKTSESCLATHTQLEKDGKKVLEGQQGLDGGPKVDSGASGFLMIVQGMSMACDGTITAEKMMDASEINPVGMISEAGVVIEEARGDLPEYPYQYCTECAIKLKPGTSEDEVKAFFENYQSEGNCDSMACVCTSTLAKLHVHTNDPGAVFKMAQEKFSIDEILLKEKVEDMFIERDQATQAPAYDMSKAKVHIMCDAAMLPYHELDHATILPAWVIDAIESRVLGDPRVNIFDVANANRHWLAEHGEPKKLDTAAPTPEQVELQFRKALDKCHNSQAEDILVLTISSMMSAMHRNVCTAAGQSADCEPLPDGGNCSLPEEARTRIHVYDTGYLGQNDLMAREAMRCAEKGMSLEEIMVRVKHVENRLYSFFVITSATKKKLAAWGRVFANLKGAKLKPEDVVDGEVCSHGIRPGPDGMAKGKIGEFVIGAPRLLPAGAPAPAQAMKAMNTFAPLAAVPEGPDAVASLVAVEIEAIKANLSPGQKLMDVCVGTPIRQDISIEIGKQIKAALPVEGEVTVVDTLVIPALCQYGEMLITYWIEDA